MTFPDFSSWSCTSSATVPVCCLVLSISDQKMLACCFPDALSSPTVSSFSSVSIFYLCFSSFTSLTPLIQLFSFLFVFHVLLSQVTQLKVGKDAFLRRLPGKRRSCKDLSVSSFFNYKFQLYQRSGLLLLLTSVETTYSSTFPAAVSSAVAGTLLETGDASSEECFKTSLDKRSGRQIIIMIKTTPAAALCSSLSL